MAEYKIGKVREVQTMEVEVAGPDDNPVKVTFFFDPDNIKDTKVSFDGGKTELPVALVEAVIGQFSERHPEFAA